MRLYVDDERDCPEGWVPARTYAEALAYLQSGEVEAISLDHDLGEAATGYDLCKWMVAHSVYPVSIHFHTANPVGRANMFQLMAHYAPEEVLVEW